MTSKSEAEIIPFIKESGPNRSTIVYFDYLWTIKKIDFNSEYYSPIFSPGCNKELKWYIKLSGTSEGMEECLCLLPCDIPEMTVTYKLGNRNSTFWATKNFQQRSSDKSISPINITEYYVDALLQRTHLFSDIYHSQTPFNMQVTCEVKLLIPEETTFIKGPACQHCGTLGILLENKKFSDVTINVCGHEFFAHKAILTVRSRVFSAMFEHEMEENLKNRVVVTDVKPTVFREMLRYIYNGQVFNIKKMASELLMAAEKYDLEGLKLMCVEELQTRLEVDNAAETLIHAYIHNAEPLKAQVAEFIRVNLSAVMKTSGFRAMTTSHPIVMADVLKAFAARPK